MRLLSEHITRRPHFGLLTGTATYQLPRSRSDVLLRGIDAIDEKFRQVTRVRPIIEMGEGRLLAGCTYLFGATRIAQHRNHLIREGVLIAGFRQPGIDIVDKIIGEVANLTGDDRPAGREILA